MKNIFFLEKLFNQDSEKGIINFASKFSLFSLILGSFALTISLSLLEGFDSTIHKLAYKFDSNYQVSTFNKSTYEFDNNIISKINNEEKVEKIYPVINNYSLIKSDKTIKAVVIKAVTNEYLNDKFDMSFKEDNSIIISKTLKDEIINDNNKLALFSFPESDNYYNYKVNSFNVDDTYETGFSEYDENIVFIKLSTAQTLFYDGLNQVNNIELITKEVSDRAFQISLEEKLGYPFLVKSTQQIHSDKFLWIEVQKQPIPIVLGLITLVSCFVVISSLLIMIVKKFKSIGILRALGMNKSDLRLYFISYGLTLGLKGSLIGTGIGLALLYIQKFFGIVKIPNEIYFLSELPVEILPINIIIIIAVSITLTLLATIIPASISIKLDPIKAIKLKD